ncbi:hypothetical protein M6B38_100710 [Iris pallida]|uniref:Uncharacterized protein n=1 Tax=Iris pallida TaxID=29817 RepID=A0AAX6INK4_IRIPA|nr:hypothetical protein M6B38_100710 [Iris pallida]
MASKSFSRVLFWLLVIAFYALQIGLVCGDHVKMRKLGDRGIRYGRYGHPPSPVRNQHLGFRRSRPGHPPSPPPCDRLHRCRNN